MRAYAFAALCGLEAMGFNLGRECDRAWAKRRRPRAGHTARQPAPPLGGVSNYGQDVTPQAGYVAAQDPYL